MEDRPAAGEWIAPPSPDPVRSRFDAFLTAVSMCAQGSDGQPPNPRLVELLTLAQAWRREVARATGEEATAGTASAAQLADVFDCSERHIRRILSGSEAQISPSTGRGDPGRYDVLLAIEIIGEKMNHRPDAARLARLTTPAEHPPARTEAPSYWEWVKANGTKGGRTPGKLNVRSQSNPLTPFQKAFVEGRIVA